MKKSLFTLFKKSLDSEASLIRQLSTLRESQATMSRAMAQKTYEEAKVLCDEKKYEQALKKISLIEENFPASSKTVSFLKGHARVELLRERNELTPLTHMKV